jgi:opacity protein-like surface antigen
MKKFLALLGLAVLSASVTAQAAHVVSLTDGQIRSIALSTLSPFDLINWKVGDTAQYDVTVGSFGKMGTMVKSVTKDEGTSIWMEENMNLTVQQQKVEVQINKADGKVLKTIVNGQEQTTPDDPIQVISQDYVDVTVPAGTFKAIHIVAKTKQVDHIEVWANPRDTVMDGTLKQDMTTQGMDIVMALTSFTKSAQ